LSACRSSWCGRTWASGSSRPRFRPRCIACRRPPGCRRGSRGPAASRSPAPTTSASASQELLGRVDARFHRFGAVVVVDDAASAFSCLLARLGERDGLFEPFSTESQFRRRPARVQGAAGGQGRFHEITSGKVHASYSHFLPVRLFAETPDVLRWPDEACERRPLPFLCKRYCNVFARPTCTPPNNSRSRVILDESARKRRRPAEHPSEHPSRPFLWVFFSECESVEQNMARVSSVSARVNAAVARFSFNSQSRVKQRVVFLRK
jgi:hypothetical protein